jgi:uncharacterized delta-60 repeat protein
MTRLMSSSGLPSPSTASLRTSARLRRPLASVCNLAATALFALFAMVALFAMFALPMPSAVAAPIAGSPDLSFGPGLVVTPLTERRSSYSLAIAMDGDRIVAGGRCDTALTSRYVFCVTRHLPDGRLDNTFGGAGKVFTLIGNNADYASEVRAIAVQPDRKIVAAGLCATNAGVYSFCLARYNADGSQDVGFDTDGQVITEFGGRIGRASLTAIALQGDGKIVAAGTCYETPSFDVRKFCMVRYQSNGALDTTFGTAGQVLTPVNASTDYAGTLLLQRDGRLVLAGRCESQFCALRYSANGVLDTSFDGDGKLSIPFGTSSSRVASLAQQADGKLLLAGLCEDNNRSMLCMARIALDAGALDASFDGDGKVIRFLGPTTGSTVIQSVLVQSDQRIVVAGRCVAGQDTFCSARMSASGQLDTSFGSGGVAQTYGRGFSSIGNYAGVLQSDGKLVQAGSCADGQGYTQFCLVRYTANGALDVSFNGGGSGVVYTQFFGGGGAWSLAVQADGKPVLGGFCSNGSNNDFCLVRYLSNGAPDPTFGTNGNGIVKTLMGFGEDVGIALLIQHDQKIILAGQCATADGTNDFCMARYLPNGSLDTNFGTGGKVFTPILGGNDGVTSALIQFDGKIVLAGYCINANGNYDFCLSRYLPDGALDPSFNFIGKVLTQLSPNADLPNKIVQQADGKLVLAGTCLIDATFDMCVARYLENGTLDTRFGTNNVNAPGPGYVSYGIGSGADTARGVALQPDGKIVMVGDCRNTTAPTNVNFCILRLLENGLLDSVFGNNGTVFPFSLNNDIAYAFALQPDGKFVLGGSCILSEGQTPQACVVRANADGTLDRTFSPNGSGYIASRLSESDTMYALALLPDGKILQAGKCSHESTNEFCLARYESGPINYQFCSLDIDDDGVVNSTVDTLIVTRAMRGMSGAAVIGGIDFAPHARRTSWGDGTDRDIRRYLRTQCGMTLN